MGHARVGDVCKEEVLAFWPVRKRQDAPLGGGAIIPSLVTGGRQ